MPPIYRKTDKGHAEIETRAHRLTPRLRQALILTDGKRSLDDLRKLLGPAPDEVLQALAAQGFIEAVVAQATQALNRPAGPVVTAQRVAPPGPAGGAAAPSPAGVASSAPTRPLTVVRPIEELRREAVRALNDLLGPMAESIALKIERARTPEELAPLLATAQQIVRNARGPQAAAGFAARFLG